MIGVCLILGTTKLLSRFNNITGKVSLFVSPYVVYIYIYRIRESENKPLFSPFFMQAKKFTTSVRLCSEATMLFSSRVAEYSLELLLMADGDT